MCILFINRNSLISGNNLKVYNSKNLKYIIIKTRQFAKIKFSIYSVSGQKLISIEQIKSGFKSNFKINFNDNNKNIKINRILNFNYEILYLHNLKWIVIGNMKTIKFKILNIHQIIMDTQLLKYSQYIKIKINNQKNVLVCLCIISIINYWSLISQKKRTQYISKQLSFINP